MKKMGLWIILIVVSAILVPIFAVGTSIFGINMFEYGWGIALFIILMLLPFVFTAILMISVFSGVFKGLPGLNKEAKKLMTQGRPGRATVLSIGETSQGTVTVNQQPFLHLELQIFDGSTQPYQVGIDSIIPRYAVPQFQPGASVPVRIDTMDKNKVIIDWSASPSSQQPTSPSSSSSYSQSQAQPTVGNVSDWSTMDDVLLKQDGIDGRARLMGVEPTGKSKGYEPLVKMTYEVTAPGMDAYTFSKDVPLPSQYISQLQNCVGRTYPCRIHPKDKTKIKVDITF